MKTCARCRREKPLDDFTRYVRNKDGRHSYCKPCMKEYRVERAASRTPQQVEADRRAQMERSRRYAEANPEVVAEGRRRWRENNPDYSREWKAKNPDKVKNYRLRKLYGITLEQFESMFEEQDGRCAICGRDEPLGVDHDHETGDVRSLLCHGCNVAIGLMQEDPDRLIAAVAYLLAKERV